MLIKYLLTNIKKSFNVIGYFAISLGIILLINYLANYNRNNLSSRAKLLNILSLSNNNQDPPPGLYSYGGSPVFIPLINNGMNKAIESKYANFRLRYTKSIDENYIKSLVDGELSFSYGERSLIKKDYELAKQRSIRLKQVAIAIDKIFIIKNKQQIINNISFDQSSKTLNSEIKNRENVNNQLKNIPINIILVKADNFILDIFGTNIKKEIIYAENYIQAFAKVIKNPNTVLFTYESSLKAQNFKNNENINIISLRDYICLQVDNCNELLIGKKIYINYREDNSDDQKAAEAYINFILSQEGKFILEKSGLSYLNENKN
ncbi:hypothetical protein NIES4102_41950 (plasmid) [Chondrocystis sp. NIES-4102]|nr:hypothetical protein NIES4102_41950 [Chondrocystis sp. NIES-4102]